MKTRLYRFARLALAPGADEVLTVPECVGPGILRGVWEEEVTSTLIATDNVEVKVGGDDCIRPFDVTSNVFANNNAAGRFEVNRFVPAGTLVGVHVMLGAGGAARAACFVVQFEHGDQAVADILAEARGPDSTMTKLVRTVIGR